MKASKHIRFVGESILAGAAFLIIPLLSRKMVLSLSRWLGDRAYSIAKRERKIAMSNLDIAFGADVSVDRKTEIIRSSFRSFALLLMDYFWFSRRTKARIEKWVTFDDSYQHYWDTKPAVVVTCHFGNWEVLGQAVALHGHPVTSVATPLKNPVVDRMLVKVRKITGQEVVAREGAIRTIMKTLRNGGRTALLLDQNTLEAEGGRFVDFFGLPVPNSTAAETLAVRTGAKIVFVYCLASDDGVYRGYALPAFSSDDVEDVTQRLADMTEEVIRKHPEKWLWMYKRWKCIPRGESPERYPYYADKTERE
ncbi:hypothetical protein BVX97_04650 [bacterium E08(2017)]|nr:hypothetical protein BVX97_04650 [bacterium E08(2017)]